MIKNISHQIVYDRKGDIEQKVRPNLKVRDIVFSQKEKSIMANLVGKVGRGRDIFIKMATLYIVFPLIQKYYSALS